VFEAAYGARLFATAKHLRPLARADDLQPGDLLQHPHRHVVLFAVGGPAHSWIYYYETGGIRLETRAQAIAALGLLALGFHHCITAGWAGGDPVWQRSADACRRCSRQRDKSHYWGP